MRRARRAARRGRACRRDASRTGACLLEELVQGPEVTVNAFSIEGRFIRSRSPTALTARPARLRCRARARLAGCQRGSPRRPSGSPVGPLEALGIENGPTYTQIVLGPEAPASSELAARLGGGHDAELAPARRRRRPERPRARCGARRERSSTAEPARPRRRLRSLSRRPARRARRRSRSSGGGRGRGSRRGHGRTAGAGWVFGPLRAERRPRRLSSSRRAIPGTRRSHAPIALPSSYSS